MDVLQLKSSVSATKYLRDRSVDINDRVRTASAILETGSTSSSTGFCLPRKEAVLLNWVFDAFKEEKNRSEIAVWKLLTGLWVSVTSAASRNRIFRNHRFIVYFTTGLTASAQSTEQNKNSLLLETLADCYTTISSSNEPLEFADPVQISNLILAYLSNSRAITEPQFDEFRTVMFKSVKLHSNLFQFACPAAALDLILREENNEMLRLFLASYLRNKENKVDFTEEKNIETLINSIIEVDLNLIEPRIVALVSKAPKYVSTALKKWDTLSPLTFTAEIARSILKNVACDADAIKTVLELRPAAVFDDSELETAVLELANTQLSRNDAKLMCPVLLESSLQRKLTAVLLDWQYTNNYSIEAVDQLKTVLIKAVDSLSPKEVCHLIKMSPLALPLVISSLSYKLAFTPSVKHLLQLICDNDEADERIKLEAFRVCPVLTVSNTKNAVLKLRQIELDLMDEQFVTQILIELKSDYDLVALRFFPLISSAVSEPEIEGFLIKCSSETRLKLASTPVVSDYKPFFSSLVNALIRSKQFKALNLVPKQLYSWSQRHETVNTALNSFTEPELAFSNTCTLVADLIDTENLPSMQLLIGYLSSAEERDASSFVKIASKIKPELTKIDISKTFKGWRRTCINAILNVPVEFNVSEVYAMGTVVEHLPPKTVFQLAVACINLGKGVDCNVFRRVCTLNPHWSLVTALFIANWPFITDASFNVCEQFSEYCKTLDPKELMCLYMQANSENQFNVIKTLVSHDIVPTEFQLVYCLCKLEKPSLEFWGLCDTALRSNRKNLVTQFAVEYMLQLICEESSYDNFDLVCSVLIKIIHKRSRIRGRVHLVICALSRLMAMVLTSDDADSITRLVEGLCKPTSVSRQTLKSVVLMERRMIQKHLPVLVSNYTTIALQNPVTGTYLREAMYPALSLLGTDGLRGIAATMDFSNHTYLRRLFEEYKSRAMWTGD